MRVQDVADFFIYAGSLNEGSEMTNARLNKLLYFAQGWHMTQFGVPLFEDDFEAWPYGPVIENIYNEYKLYGRNIITNTSKNFDIDAIDSKTFDFLMDVFANYYGVSTAALINETHKKGSPWNKVYNGNKGTVIPKESIKEYFVSCSKMETIKDIISKIPTVGYINEEGITVLPDEYNS